MAGYGFSRHHTLLESGSTLSSTFTSNAFLVADWNAITLSYLTQAAAASTLTVQGSNNQGLLATSVTSNVTEGAWSNLTVLSAAGMYAIEPGVRWMRCIRTSADSMALVQLAGRVY